MQDAQCFLCTSGFFWLQVLRTKKKNNLYEYLDKTKMEKEKIQEICTLIPFWCELLNN